ncbi:hypothetical protein [Chryseobacterium sp.]|uniref:hypothetical protein n=1 Tax=Chryseobacterium sp. TaxID=1871047 RepID=UPI001B12596E|nr:hypothetical protein [Chryseobacterium sp.]MBO9691998.1 hypothetical protein [Chryseobacterium sp.]
MKKIIFLLFVSAYSASFGQLQNTAAPTDVFMHYRVNSKNGKQLSYDDIKGSPYNIKEFRSAKISENYETIMARYNSYTDEVEFQKNDKIYVLPKNDVFSNIIFTNTKDKLVYLTDKSDLSGYFFEIVSGKNTLLKKIKTVFIDVIPAESSYSEDKPAKFQTESPIYYIKTENGIIKSPGSKNNIIDNFPGKKEALDVFFKSNKIKFNKEEDLIKLVNFLNT